MSDICYDFSYRSTRSRWGYSILIFLTVVSAIMLGVSLKKLTSVQYGIEYDKWAKKLDDAAKEGGLHIGPVGFYFVKFPSTQISTVAQDTCVSRDGLRVNFYVEYQYQMPKEHIRKAVVKYRNFKKWGEIVEAAGNSGIQHSCSEFNITDYQRKRSVIQNAMFDNVRIKLEGSLTEFTDNGVYARVVSLQLKDVAIPPLYTRAVADKKAAEEDINLAKNQRFQNTTKANTMRLAANEEALKILATANNDANVTLTRAYYMAEETKESLEKEQEVLIRATDAFNLDADGIISYMANQLYSKASNLKVISGEPARISLKDEIST